ncbi:N-acetylmuramoyl-L-alanine amidase, partial [Candidatus Hakubella thermalkaliphila]
VKRVTTLIVAVSVFLSMFSPWLTSTAQAAPGNYLIVLDPGDGGVVGATGPTGLQEKVVNLDIALRVRDRLVGAGYRVIMTRDSDNPVSLAQRVDIANRNNASVFVSIHTNAVSNREVHGTETYFSSRGAPYGFHLANHIQSRVVINTGSQSRGVKDGAFFVLTHTTMPAALQEGEFISNPDKEALLRTDAFRDKIAQGIFEGIVNFLNEYGAATISPTNYTYRAAYNDYQRTPSSLSPGQQVSFPFAVRNLSNFTWSSSPPNQVNLSYHLYDSRGRMVTSLNGLRSPLPRNVAPGEVVEFTATIQAPTSLGTYTIAYDMVHEGVSWFSQKGAGMERRTFSVGGTASASPTPSGAVTNDTSLVGVSQVTEQQ